MRCLGRAKLLAIAADEPRKIAAAMNVEYLTRGDGGTGKCADLCEQRLWDRGVPTGRFLDNVLARNDCARLRVGAYEDGVERLRDGVGQHERSTDHRDSEHDREPGEHGAQLAPEDALYDCLVHRRLSSSIAASTSLSDSPY